MTLGDLITAFRTEADDTAQPHRWLLPELARHASEAQEEAAARSRCLLDATTPEVVKYAVKASDPWVTLHTSIIRIEHAQLETPVDGAAPRIELLDREMRYDMDRRDPHWRESVGGGVCRYVPDLSTGKIRLYRVPTYDATLRLEVARMPLCDLKHEKDRIEIPHPYAKDLVHWMLWRAFGNRDADVYDVERADRALAIFEGVFGTRSSVADEVWIGQTPGRRRSTVRFS